MVAVFRWKSLGLARALALVGFRLCDRDFALVVFAAFAAVVVFAVDFGICDRAFALVFFTGRREARACAKYAAPLVRIWVVGLGKRGVGSGLEAVLPEFVDEAGFESD